MPIMRTEWVDNMERSYSLLKQARQGIASHGPTRTSILPTEGAARKRYPVASGLMDYFPDALVEVSHVSFVGNDQHNPGQPLFWNRSKSTDEADTLIRHFLQRGGFDSDGLRHSAKVAWRALALLQKEIEEDQRKNGNNDKTGTTASKP